MNWLNDIRASLADYPGIARGVWWNVVLLIGSLAALPFDQRKILGLNPWIKPLKFEISVILFLITMALMLRALGPLDTPGTWPRSRQFLGWGFAISMIVENSIIALQAARGVRSHMNYTTAHDGILFGIMGLFILLNTILAAALLALWCRSQPQLPPAVVWGTRLGLLMLLAASIEGVRIVNNAGHTVGAPDGGAGLPFVNWSTTHGDLRIAHFFALHALQIFPLIGILLAKTRFSVPPQLAALLIIAGAYAAGVWWLFAEAMQGIPLAR